MNKVNMETAIKRYNRIMNTVCYEHATIGELLSENTSGDPENNGNRLWTLRDMVAECDYILSTYYEGGHCNEELRHLDADCRKTWRQETGFLKRFIDRYAPMLDGVEAFQGHCSPYSEWKDGRYLK